MLDLLKTETTVSKNQATKAEVHGLGFHKVYPKPKSLSPHCDQEGQGRDNFFSKCIFYARSYGGNVKNRSKKCEEPSVIGPESSIPDLKSLGSSNCWI